MKAVDLRVGIALAMLAAAVLWSAQAFPVVPGQQLGSGFLPKLVGAGLLLCGLGLVVRSLRGAAYGDLVAAPTASWRDIGSALLILATAGTRAAVEVPFAVTTRGLTFTHKVASVTVLPGTDLDLEISGKDAPYRVVAKTGAVSARRHSTWRWRATAAKPSG